jgi:hypothetical protein
MKMMKQEEGVNEWSKEDEEQTEENMKVSEMYFHSIAHDRISQGCVCYFAMQGT